MIRSAAVAVAAAGLALCAVPAVAQQAEQFTLTVRTDDVYGAGTDNDVHVRVECAEFSSAPFVKLDKSGYNDFERGDVDSYTIPRDPRCQHPEYVAIKLTAINTIGHRDTWKLHSVTVETADGKFYGDTPAQVGEQKHPVIYPNVWGTTDIVLAPQE